MNNTPKSKSNSSSKEEISLGEENDSQPEIKTETTETKNEVKIEIKTEVKTEVKTDSKTESLKQPSQSNDESEDIDQVSQRSFHEPQKIFVGGLSQDTTEDYLREYFEDFGEVIECIIKYNNENKISRGFGFVTFKDEKTRNAVLSQKNHQILGHKIECKKAMTKELAFQRQNTQNETTRKLYVNNIPKGQKKEDIEELFSQYGTVTKVNLVFKEKDFGVAFVFYETELEAQKVMKEQEIFIGDTKLTMKFATLKKDLEKEKPSGKKKLRKQRTKQSIYETEEEYIPEEMRLPHPSSYQKSFPPAYGRSASHANHEYAPEYMQAHYQRQMSSRTTGAMMPPPPPSNAHHEIPYGYYARDRIIGYLKCQKCAEPVPVPSTKYRPIDMHEEAELAYRYQQQMQYPQEVDYYPQSSAYYPPPEPRHPYPSYASNPYGRSPQPPSGYYDHPSMRSAPGHHQPISHFERGGRKKRGRNKKKLRNEDYEPYYPEPTPGRKSKHGKLKK